MRRHFRRFVRSSAALILSSTLFACGGGGSSAPAPPAPPAPPPPPPAEAALLVTSANAEAVTVLGFGFGGIALGLGQLAVDWTAQVDSSATLSFANQCAGGGTATATLADRDGDRHASAGDTVSVVLLNCYLKELDDTFDGTVTVTLTAPLASQQRAGVITFSGFGVHNTTPRQDVVGALRFDYSASRLSKKVHVYSDTQSYGVTFSDAAKSLTDMVSALDAAHETRLDTVRATTSMRFHLVSNLLVGSLDVTTPTEWSALLDTYPDAGEISVAGASGSKASLRAAPAKGGVFDVLAAGTPVATVSADGSGLLWSGAPWMPEDASAAHYAIEPASATVFRPLIQPAPAQIRPNGPLAWVYSRPLDPLSVTPATFIQRGYKMGIPAMNVPAKITVEGGMLSYTPSVQLQLGVSYDLMPDTYASTIRDVSGAVLTAPQFGGQVPQSVTASIASGPAVLLGSGATLVLDASGSSANGRPASSYRWHQLSGPALVLADATSPRVTLSAAAGAGNGIAVVELEAANAAGEFDRLQVNVTVGADVSTTLVIAYRAGTAPATVLSNIAMPGSGYAHYLPTNNVLDVILENARLLLGLNGGQTWQAGQKLSYGAGNTSGVVGPGWLGCIGSTGNLSILEFALDQSGNLARLAVDVDDNCGTTGIVTLGSIRYHSTLPLRP